MSVTGNVKMLLTGAAVVLAAAACSATRGGDGAGQAVRAGGTIVAENGSFDASEIELEAREPSTLTFRNQDSMPHNIVIRRDGHDPVFEGRIIEGGDSATHKIPALDAGEYEFVCELHSNMTGAVKVTR